MDPKKLSAAIALNWQKGYYNTENISISKHPAELKVLLLSIKFYLCVTNTEAEKHFER